MDSNKIIAMNTWAGYNGDDDAPEPTMFISTDEARKYAEEYAEFEPFIADIDNWMDFPVDGTLEYYNVDDFCDLMDKWLELDDFPRKIAGTLIDNGYAFDEAIDKIDDVFAIEASTETDLAYAYIEEAYGDVQNMDKDTLEQYIDWEEVKRLEMQDNDDYYREMYEEEHGSEYDEYDYEAFKENMVDDFIAEAEGSPADYLANLDYYFDYDQFGRDLSWDAIRGDDIFIFA